MAYEWVTAGKLPLISGNSSENKNWIKEAPDED